MIRSTASKVMWVGRATVFLVGLAVILALIFGVASTALGANGDNFRLGKKNVASAISTLVKQGPGPALKLQVGAGQPPLAVSSSARVTNLNADTLDGVDASQFQQRVAQSGQVLSGQLAARYIVDDRHFTLVEASYPVPLPANTATPTLQYVPGAPTADCPGIGQAAPGVLCIYAYNASNIDRVTFGGSVSGNSKLYGFSLDVFPTAPTSSGYLLANWAYRVP